MGYTLDPNTTLWLCIDTPLTLSLFHARHFQGAIDRPCLEDQ